MSTALFYVSMHYHRKQDRRAEGTSTATASKTHAGTTDLSRHERVLPPEDEVGETIVVYHAAAPLVEELEDSGYL